MPSSGDDDFLSSAFSIIGNSAAPYAYIGPTPRFIGGIVADVTVEEVHLDEAMITEHPVETGAPISDHMYLRPQELECKVGFSNSTAQSEGWVQAAYQLFIALQQARQPFAVSTGKRYYPVMLVRALRVTTEQYTENVLNLVVSMKQLLTASTSSSGSTAASGPTTPTDTSTQADPQQTSANVNTGNQQLASATISGSEDAPPSTSQYTIGSNNPALSFAQATDPATNASLTQFSIGSNNSNSWAQAGSQPGF